MLGLERPVEGIAPGQAAVFYQGDRVLGRRLDRQHGLGCAKEPGRRPVTIPPDSAVEQSEALAHQAYSSVATGRRRSCSGGCARPPRRPRSNRASPSRIAGSSSARSLGTGVGAGRRVARPAGADQRMARSLNRADPRARL
ncbi:MAG: aminomethyltransferase beta-barrel domain-containing protein [Pseudomonadota bacterium]